MRRNEFENMNNTMIVITTIDDISLYNSWKKIYFVTEWINIFFVLLNNSQNCNNISALKEYIGSQPYIISTSYENDMKKKKILGKTFSMFSCFSYLI